MKIVLRALLIAFVALIVGVSYNLISEDGINPFKCFGGDHDISLDSRAITDINIAIDAFEKARAVFIDTRSSEEYKEAHIPGALNASYFYMERAYAFISEKIHTTDLLILYGEDSMDIAPVRTADYYEHLGFNRVRILYGGLERWINEGLPVERNIENE